MEVKSNPSVSLFKCCKSPFVTKEVSISDVLYEIKTGGQKAKFNFGSTKAGKEIYFPPIIGQYFLILKNMMMLKEGGLGGDS